MKKRTKRILLIAVLLCIVAIVLLIVFNKQHKELVIRTEQVEEGKLEVTVMATGYINPVEEVEVGTQVSGVIEKIYADFNSHVKKGQLLAELDKLTLQEKVNTAQSSLLSAQSDMDYAKQNYDRVKKLFDSDAATLVSYQDALNKYTQAKTNLENAQSNLSQAKVNLGYAYIYSPIDGVILDRSVNPGQTVAASFSTPTLFTIAEDLTKMQVEADVDEADIGQIKVGQRVTFTVDAYNDDVFEGTVSQIRLQPTVTNNVVTYTVIIEAPNPEEKLFPGMTANITIIVKSEKGLLVPLEAFNFFPEEKVAAELGMTLPQGEKGAVKKAKTGMATPTAGMNGKPNGNGNGNGNRRMIWVKSEDRVEPRPIETGMNDGIHCIAISGVKSGEEVMLSASREKTADRKGVNIMPGPPGRR